MTSVCLGFTTMHLQAECLAPATTGQERTAGEASVGGGGPDVKRVRREGADAGVAPRRANPASSSAARPRRSERLAHGKVSQLP